MRNLFLTITFFSFIQIGVQSQTVSDFDGNTYNTITIGSQTWLKENLKVTHYNNGDTIPNVKDNAAWAALSTDAYCHYNNNANNTSTYGLLYNFYTVIDSRKLCPTGWHIPSDVEWTQLSTFLGGATIAGGKMKEIGNTHWLNPNIGATNSSGFSGLPAGLSSSTDGNFGYQTEGSGFWSNTQLNTNEAWDRFLVYGDAQLDRFNQNKKTGYSVRCVKDITQSINEKNSKSLKIYPNPTNELLNIVNLNDKILDITVVDVNGKTVYYAKTSNNTINISKLQKGNYIIKLQGIDWGFQEKIIKI